MELWKLKPVSNHQTTQSNFVEVSMVEWVDVSERWPRYIWLNKVIARIVGSMYRYRMLDFVILAGI